MKYIGFGVVVLVLASGLIYLLTMGINYTFSP